MLGAEALAALLGLHHLLLAMVLLGTIDHHNL